MQININNKECTNYLRGTAPPVSTTPGGPLLVIDRSFSAPAPAAAPARATASVPNPSASSANSNLYGYSNITTTADLDIREYSPSDPRYDQILQYQIRYFKQQYPNQWNYSKSNIQNILAFKHFEANHNPSKCSFSLNTNIQTVNNNNELLQLMISNPELLQTSFNWATEAEPQNHNYSNDKILDKLMSSITPKPSLSSITPKPSLGLPGGARPRPDRVKKKQSSNDEDDAEDGEECSDDADDEDDDMLNANDSKESGIITLKMSYLRANTHNFIYSVFLM